MREVLAAGAIAGYPMQDVRVIVYDGKHHAVDSKEVAFVTAGRKAFLDAHREGAADRARADREHRDHCPEGNMGDITGDLSGKRGQISGTNRAAGDGDGERARAAVGAERLRDRLKSVTGGQGSYSHGALALRAGAAERAAAAAHRVQGVTGAAGRGLAASPRRKPGPSAGYRLSPV